MNICIPVNENNGMASTVCAHFGSAPMFLFVDVEKGTCRTKQNDNQHHGHGMCRPLAAIEGESVDGVVVGGIGAGALNKLNAAGITVFRSIHETVAETVNAFREGRLSPVQPQSACAHHGSGDGHGHGHGCK